MLAGDGNTGYKNEIDNGLILKVLIDNLCKDLFTHSEVVAVRYTVQCQDCGGHCNVISLLRGFALL